MSLPLNSTSDSENRQNNCSEKMKTRWAFAACFAAVSGSLCGLLGILMSFLAHFEAGDYGQFNGRVGSWLVIAALPAFMFAAHALDRITFYEKAEITEKQTLTQ